MSLPRFTALASGRGSGFESIMRAIESGALKAQCMGLICDRPGAAVLEKAAVRGLPSAVVPSRGNRADHDQAVLNAVRVWDPELTGFLVMAGYMRVVTAGLLDPFRTDQGYTRVVNIHPSLLPAFPGLDAYGQAYRYGCRSTGVTIHLVEEKVDSGPICAQETFSIADCQNEEEVETRGLAIEHRLYPQTLNWVLPEKFEVESRGGRLCVRPN